TKPEQFQARALKSHFGWYGMAVKQRRRGQQSVSARVRESQHVTYRERRQRTGLGQNVRRQTQTAQDIPRDSAARLCRVAENDRRVSLGAQPQSAEVAALMDAAINHHRLPTAVRLLGNDRR